MILLDFKKVKRSSFDGSSSNLAKVAQCWLPEEIMFDIFVSDIAC